MLTDNRYMPGTDQSWSRRLFAAGLACLLLISTLSAPARQLADEVSGLSGHGTLPKVHLFGAVPQQDGRWSLRLLFAGPDAADTDEVLATAGMSVAAVKFPASCCSLPGCFTRTAGQLCHSPRAPPVSS